MLKHLLFSALVTGVLVGCEYPAESPTPPDDLGVQAGHGTVESADVNRAIAELRRWSARFHDLETAKEYGYDVGVGCVSDPDRGGMGYHFTRGDKDLIGDGEVDLMEPEFLVYMPDRSGQMKLLSFDYFVPFSTWDEPEPPSLLGQEFHHDDGFQAWVIHIWLWRHNPAGMFADYNPAVPQCPAS